MSTGGPWVTWGDWGLPEAWVFGSKGGLTLPGHPRALFWRWHRHPLLCSGWDSVALRNYWHLFDIEHKLINTLPSPLTFREVFSLAQICGSTVQKPCGTIKELQHPFAADSGGWVWPRCQLCWQRRNSASLGLRDYLMPRRTRTSLRWPGLRTRTVWPLLQQAVCGLSFQWYDMDIDVT